MNPSNFGIAIVLLLFPWVAIAPPYHFTENLSGPPTGSIVAVILVLRHDAQREAHPAGCR